MSLVETYGEDRIWQAGLQSLGYPPTLATHKYEFETVKQQLEKEYSHGFQT